MNFSQSDLTCKIFYKLFKNLFDHGEKIYFFKVGLNGNWKFFFQASAWTSKFYGPEWLGPERQATVSVEPRKYFFGIMKE